MTSNQLREKLLTAITRSENKASAATATNILAGKYNMHDVAAGVHGGFIAACVREKLEEAWALADSQNREAIRHLVPGYIVGKYGDNI